MPGLFFYLFKYIFLKINKDEDDERNERRTSVMCAYSYIPTTSLFRAVSPKGGMDLMGGSQNRH